MRLLYGGRTGASNMNGKGDRPRPVDLEKYAANYDAIFRKPTLKPEKVDSYFNPRRFYSLFKKTK